MPVACLEEILEADEFDRWIEFWSVEGFGEGKADLRAGIIAATMANCHRGRSTRAFTAQDFMPQRKTTREETAEEQIRKLDIFFGMHNAALAKG